jgi:hypothetical protein
MHQNRPSMIDAGAVRCVPVEHLLGEVVDMRRTQDQGAGAGASVGVLPSDRDDLVVLAPGEGGGHLP